MAGVRIQMDAFEINLLQEPHRHPGVSVAVVLATVIFLAGVLAPVWLWHDANRRMEASYSQLDGLDRQLLELQAQNQSVSDAQGAQALLGAVEQLQQFRPSAGGIMDKLNRLLPLEANMQGLVYANGRVQLTLHFASLEHIITFLNEIENSETFTLVSFDTMNNQPVEETEQTGTPIGLSWEDVPADGDGLLSFLDEWNIQAAGGEVVPSFEQKEAKTLPVTSVMFELAYQSGEWETGAEQEGQQP